VIGSREQIIAIQTELTRLNLYHYTIDGIAGSRTSAGMDQVFGQGHWHAKPADSLVSELRKTPAHQTASAGGHTPAAATHATATPAHQPAAPLAAGAVLFEPNATEASELQAELKRLNCLQHDPKPGFGPEARAALHRGWGNDSWEQLSASDVITRLKSFRTPLVNPTPAPVKVKWSSSDIRAIQAELHRLDVIGPGARSGHMDTLTIIGLNKFYNGDAWKDRSAAEVLGEMKPKVLFLDKDKQEQGGKPKEPSLWEKAEMIVGGFAATEAGIIPPESPDHPTDPKARAAARVQALQDKVNEVSARCKAGTVTPEDKKWLHDLYWGVVVAGYAAGHKEASDLLANYLRDGKQDPYSMSPSLYKKSPVVLAEAKEQKKKAAQMLGSQSGPVKQQSHMLLADSHEMLMCTNHFYLQSTATKRGSKMNIEFKVDHTYYFESYDRNKSTPLGVGGVTVDLPHGMSKYLIQLGMAKEFYYYAMWEDDIEPSDLA
jgi:hypothetical protein